MTSHITMNELVELATLDAFGLLPAADSVKFEQAFMTAPAEVQAEIRRIQADLAADTTTLGSEEPSEALRQRVLDAVGRTIETEAERLAPLATIGDKGPHIEPVAYNTPSTSGGILASVWTWRMAALIMFGVVVTLAVFNASSQREASMLASTHTTLNTLDALEDQFGPQFTEFINNPNCRHYYLGSPRGDGMIRVTVNELNGNTFVLGLDLDPQERNMQLRIVSQDGTMQPLTLLQPKEGFVGQAIEGVDMNLFAVTTFDRIELVGADGTVLFRSA
jgi:hypothetical protein